MQRQYATPTPEATKTQLEELAQIEEKNLKDLANVFAEYEKLMNHKSRIYNNYMDEQTSEYLDGFRVELLKHLAGSIIVKEHRFRYQQEQFDRFIHSLNDGYFKKHNITLKEFCLHYAYLIEDLIESSHHFKSPKIEANYNDYQERTIRPINATIFYYFFSMDRRKRTLAQWLLSTVRYPNDRIRRAYMRFFA